MPKVKNLISLEEFNTIKVNILKSYTHKNGIACPTCGEELYDNNPQQMLLSDPPKINIYCKHCGFKGYRYV